MKKILFFCKIDEKTSPKVRDFPTSGGHISAKSTNFAPTKYSTMTNSTRSTQKCKNIFFENFREKTIFHDFQLFCPQRLSINFFFKNSKSSVFSALLGGQLLTSPNSEKHVPSDFDDNMNFHVFSTFFHVYAFLSWEMSATDPPRNRGFSRSLLAQGSTFFQRFFTFMLF